MIFSNRAVPRGRAHLVIAALVAALLVLAAVPAFAAAAAENYVVDSAADSKNETPGTNCGPTALPGEECTLRAAIELADAEAEPATIELSSSPFNGAAFSSEIILNEPLPAIEYPTRIFSSAPCSEGTQVKPCAGLIVPSGAIGLKVEGDGVTIEDIAIGGGTTGIEVIGKNFGVHGVWFGARVTGTVKPIQENGVFIAPSGDDATIGSSDPGPPRNVFTNSLFGIFIGGASGVKVQGNYIGVRPDGSTLAGVAVPVSIANFGPAAPAEEEEVGGVLTPTEAQTPACDGPCNVIAASSGIGISLTGESTLTTEAPVGPISIRGNYVGLDASGTEAVEFGPSEPEYGIRAVPTETGHPGPARVTIGGVAPTETNYFEGGETTILAEAAKELRIAGNRIGVAADNSESESPTEGAINVVNGSADPSATIAENQLVLSPDPTGIEVDGNTEIVKNTIQGSYAAIKTTEAGLGASLIEGNTINEADSRGIEIEDDSNVVIGNSITNGGKYGIQLSGSSTEHNRIGGDGPGEANVLIGNGSATEGGAIVVSGPPSWRNEIAANNGSGNALAFIRGEGYGAGEFLSELEPPTVAGVQSGASGTAKPNATVRIFGKASPESGELGALLAVVEADGTGAWKATYAKQPVGALVAATQTRQGGTSGVSAPVATIIGPQEEQAEKEAAEKAAQEQREREAKEKASGGSTGGTGTSSGSGTSGPPPPPAVAKVAPKVSIVSGPKKTTEATTAKFKFKVTNTSGAKFECKLDNAKWAKCSSPKSLKKLKVGKHTFRVRATANGLTGGVVKYQFTVKG